MCLVTSAIDVGLLVPAGKGSTFEKNVQSLLADQDELTSIVFPMLEAWRGIRARAAELGQDNPLGSKHCQMRANDWDLIRREY
jgi:hypothetical protein